MNLPDKPGIYFQEVPSNHKSHGRSSGFVEHPQISANNDDEEKNSRFITTRIKWGGPK